MYIVYILLSIFIILLIYNIYEKKKIEKLSKEELIKCNKELERDYLNKKENYLWEFSRLQAQKEEELRQANEKITSAQNDANLCTARLQSLEQNLESQRKSNAEIISQLQAQQESKKENISLYLENFYNQNYNSYRVQLDKVIAQMKEESKEELAAFLEENSEEVETALQNLSSLKAEIEEYRQKRDTINQEIQRQRQISENLEFYKIQIPDDSKEDIEILSSIIDRLSKKESFKKLLYDTYISKPVNEMIKRVLAGRAPCGIYKITRLKTGEIYIGKSSDIKSRWGQHCKSAFDVGTIAHSQLHTTIKKDGIENFTFEVIEECPKEELFKRESYWIQFYGSKEFGLNEKL